MTGPKTPPNFLGLMIALASLAVSAFGIWLSANKSDVDATRRLEQRLCRIEANTKLGECGH